MFTVKRLAMINISIRKAPAFLRGLTIAVAPYGAVVPPAAFAQPSGTLIFVPPAELPDLARQSGDAMLLQSRSDGSTLLYIEQMRGCRAP